MKKSGKVTVNFDISPDDREQLRILAAKARMSQSELMRRLIADYGEQLVRSLREPTITPESGLPDDPRPQLITENGRFISWDDVPEQ